MDAHRDDLENQLIAGLRAHRQEFIEFRETISGHWGYEDAFYRFYHQSFKVYSVQRSTERAVLLLKQLLPGQALNEQFLRIVADGTGTAFSTSHNADWDRHTRPMLEAFAHARFMIEMAVKYSDLESPPRPLPSGYAALLYLFNIR